MVHRLILFSVAPTDGLVPRVHSCMCLSILKRILRILPDTISPESTLPDIISPESKPWCGYAFDDATPQVRDE